MGVNKTSPSSGFIVSICFLLLLLLHLCDGLTVKAIFKDTLSLMNSPSTNLSSEETAARLHLLSKTRCEQMVAVRQKKKQNQIENPDSIRPPIATYGFYPLAMVGIGTIPGRIPNFINYYLVLDAGSSNIWTQCEGCNPCFHQADELFPCTKSTSYHPLGCNDPGCTKHPCNPPAQCPFSVQYTGGSSVDGILASERFTFNSDNGGTETIDNLRFGCGFKQVNFPFPEGNPLSGILGIGPDTNSLTSQIKVRQGGHVRYSYCLRPFILDGRIKEISTFLRFGEDAHFKHDQKLHTTPLTTDVETHSYVTLVDISVAGVRLNFAPGTFDRKDDKGGAIIDTGNPITSMHRTQFDIVVNEVKKYFAKLGTPLVKFGATYELCYKNTVGDHFPVIIFHFAGDADYAVFKEDAFRFFRNKQIFCLSMRAIEDVTQTAFVLGSDMQTNRRFLYLFGEEQGTDTVSFAYEDCSKEG